MNAQRHVLPELEVSLENVGDTTRAILHTILLCRALGEVTPREGACKNYPTLGYAKCSNADAEVGKIVDRVKRSHERKPIGPDLSKVDIVVSFYEKREKSGLLGFVSTEERFYWEHWLLPLVVNSSPGNHSEYLKEEERVRATLFRIATLVNERTEHLPHLPSHSNTVFPFEIKLAGDDESAKQEAINTWSITRILQQARPPL